MNMSTEMKIMQEESFTQRISGLVNTLRCNINKTQVSCCMNELAEILDKADFEQINEIDGDDIHEVVLNNMGHHGTDVEIQRDGIFSLYHLMKDNKEIQNKLITLRIPYITIELMSKYPDDIIIQAIGCRIINILIQFNYQTKQDIIGMEAVGVITKAVENFENEDDLQLWALQALTNLLQEQTEEQFYFLQKDYFVLALDRSEKLLECSEIIQQTIILLTVLAESSRFTEYFTEADIITVFHFMKYHEDFSDVQSSGCSLLLELVKTEGFHEPLVNNDVDLVMLRIMEKHPNREGIQRKCMEFFQMMCKPLLDVHPEDQRVHKVHQLLDGIMIAMSTHCDNPSVLITACDTLLVISTHYPDMTMLIDDQRGNTPLHNAIMAALVLHIDDASVCMATCRAIACIAMHSDTIQQILFEKGVYIYILKAMEKHDQIAGVQQFACQSLRLLCLPSVENMTVLICNEAWERITECISSFKDNAGVLLEAIAIVACLATDLEIIRNQCAVEKLYVPILAAIKIYPKDATLVEVAFEAIGVLAACEAMPDLLVSEGVTKTFLDAMEQHIHDISIQQKGCILVQIFSSYLKDEWCVGAVRSVIMAMQEFPDDECVQAEGCVALKLIAQVSPHSSEILVNQCAHERLFIILDKFRNKRRLIELASGVLWFLTQTRQLNSRMLLSACAGGLIRGAHCLIQLGANVNIGEGTNTPLCAACKNNKEDMVRFLLTQGITDIHTALNLCLEMEHHNLVGILLQKMGHDRVAGIVSWNGLNLGSVRPEWLFPSLVGSAFGLEIETERYCNYLQCAERAFRQRFKVLEKCTTLASNGVVDRQTMQRCITDEYSDEEASDNEAFYPTSDEGSWEGNLLSEKAPLRARTLSGAALPYSSYDPRVVVPLNVGDPILLPRRSQPNTSIRLNEYTNGTVLPGISWHKRSKSMYDKPNVSLLDESEDETPKVRKVSDVVKPTFELHGLAFMYGTPYKRRNKSVSETSEHDSEDGALGSLLVSRGSSRKRRRKTTYLPRGQTDARVCALNVSGNRISDLESLSSLDDNDIKPYLVNIENLDLSNNQLTNLPCGFCVAMPNLRQARLSCNNLTEFPFILTKSRRLKILDLSSNNLQLQEDCPDNVSKAVLMEHLSLAGNYLRVFPRWLADVFPGLTYLSVAENELETFPETTGEKFQYLKTLDVSKNRIVSIPDSFLDEFSSLETLNASNNELSSLPESQTDCDSKLTTLRLAHNHLTEEKPFFIPRFILRLSRLSVLDLSHNLLTCLPPLETWKTKQLKDLNVADNKIRRIDFDMVNPRSWSTLERLNLRNNGLKDVPKGIGLLTSLTSLDLSLNPEIRSLPDELGRLSNLWDLQLTGLKLDLEESLLANTKKLIAFFNSKLMNSVPYYRMKLVTVGLEKRGKTTLLNQLLKSKSSQPQNELVIRDWTLRDWKATCKQCHHKSVIYTINTWDMKGREDLYQAFQTLMTSRTLYLAVYDITNGGKEFEALRPWLQTIHACAPDVPVMLVGTHLDKVPKDSMKEVLDEMRDRARVLFLSPGLPDIKAHVVLNCTEETPGIQTLRNKIVELVVKCKCKGHSILGSRVPQKFVKLQELIEKVVKDSNGYERVLNRTELKKLLQENDVSMSDSEIGQAVKFLHEAGVLLHYDDPVAHLSDLFFIDPVWLSQVVSSVVSARKLSGLVTNGIVSKNDLIGFLEEDNDKSMIVHNFLPQYFRLLERFGVLLPISESEFLVPSRLPTQPPASVNNLPDLTSNCFYRRFYEMAFVPLGFWSRLITRILLFLPMMDLDDEDNNNPPRKEYWQSGIHVCWSAQSYFTVFQDTSKRIGANIIAIVVPNNDYGSYLLSNLVDHVDVLIEEWFPDMCELDPVEGLPLVSRLCPCITCEGDNCHVFMLDECIEHALRYEEIVCSKTSEFLPVVKVAPDVELADLKLKNLLIKENELTLEQKREFVLGDGGFGSVYKATYNDRVVAVKVFHTEGHITPHRLLRQEVPFLANLRHPSIITLIGVCVQPRALVLEVAPLGSLSSLLNKGEPLSRGLQHRITLQIVEGLAHLHRHMIVYRDMKPHNILIFSLSLSIVINAKISDFGIARYTPMYGLKSSEGTPGYRAPEVVRGDVAYNKAADLYSFGMLLYELVTGGRRPFEELRFRNELDAAVMQGRMIDPITTDNGSSPWPDIEDLIEHLLEPRADMRPTAEQVVERLSTAELLCLKRVIAVSKKRAVECITVRNDDANIELWMGSGVDGDYGGQVSWLSLTNANNEGCQGTGIDDKRVTSMTTVHHNRILVGTQSGRIWVFDALSHTRLHPLERLPHTVISLRHYSNVKTNDDLVFAGLANGSLVIYQTKDLEKEQAAPRESIPLCKTEKDGGECLDKCQMHPVACLALGQKCIYCGCGNEVVVYKIVKNSVVFKRRWPVEDRRKQCVLNIAVGSSSVWTICTSTKDSSHIDFWDISKPVLRGTVNCAKIVKSSCESHDTRVVCMLLHEQTTLWVGLGTGHVIILSTKTREPLYVLKRHTGSVRCMAVACRSSSHGRPVSLVMTGGMSFIERPGSRRKDGDFGHVLVWEADLPEQSKRLHADKTKRQQMPIV